MNNISYLSNVMHPVVFCIATQKRLFTVNTTLLIFILISHVSKATRFNQPW